MQVVQQHIDIYRDNDKDVVFDIQDGAGDPYDASGVKFYVSVFSRADCGLSSRFLYRELVPAAGLTTELVWSVSAERSIMFHTQDVLFYRLDRVTTADGKRKTWVAGALRLVKAPSPLEDESVFVLQVADGDEVVVLAIADTSAARLAAELARDDAQAAKAAAEAARDVALSTEVGGLTQRVDELALSYERPGETPEYYTAASTGGASPLATDGESVVNARGPALRLGGNKRSVLRRRFPLGNGQAWKVRATLSRFADPASLPGNDVLLRATWLDDVNAAAGSLLLWPETSGYVLSESDGVVKVEAVVGEGSLVTAPTPPAAAAAMVLELRTLGTDGETDFETLEVVPIEYGQEVGELSDAIATETAVRAAAIQTEAEARDALGADLQLTDRTIVQTVDENIGAPGDALDVGLWAAIVESGGRQWGAILVNADGSTSFVPAADVVDVIDARRLSAPEGDPGAVGSELMRAAVDGLDVERVVLDANGVARPYLVRTGATTHLYDCAGPLVMLAAAGQSLSIGGGATGMPDGEEVANDVPLSPAHLVMFDDGLGMRGRGTTAATVPADYTDFLPGVEAFNGFTGETQGSGLGSWLHREAERRRERPASYLFRSHGAGGQEIANLVKGTQPYANGLTDVAKAVEVAAAYGKEVHVPAIFWTQGQEDANLGTTAAAYKAALSQLLADYRADWGAVLPAGNPTIALILDQVAAKETGFIGEVSQAQWEFARDTAGVYLSTPDYIFPLVDGVHLRPEGYALLGEYQAKAWRRVVVEGEDWKALWPVSLTEDGRDILIRFNVPRGALVFDTVTMPAAEHFGFSVVDTGGATIEGVEIEGNTVRLRMSAATVANASRRVRYAWDGPGDITGRAGAWGNLRDSDDALSFQQPGRRLFNWCVAFNEAF